MPRATLRRVEGDIRRPDVRTGAARDDPRPDQTENRRPDLTPSVDVIVVNWNGRDDTLRCLAAVAPQLTEVHGSVVTVVDNGSTDGSIAAITATHPSARFIPLGTNRGFTGGLAAALATSRARNVIFLNNDAVPEPGWLAAFTRAMDEAPDDVVSVGGRIISLDGKLIDFIGGAMTFDGHAFQEGFRMAIGSRPEPKPGDEILFACGGNMISRREALLELGAFDDDYFAYLEDVDFGWRTWIAGGRALFEPRATVRHASSATSNRLGDFERGVLFERNALQTAIKNFEKLQESASSILFTYLHRLHHYATTRNANAQELTRELGTPSTLPLRERGLRGRVKRKVRGTPPLAAIDDPLTAMQFRAFDWILRNEAKLAEKRARVQAMRKRSDREIFERFPLLVVPTYPGDDTLMSTQLFRLLRGELPSVERTLSDIIAR
ncbi:MAG TPA: glycosyltransferase family 2 protein [Thermoanaerobaculia bacterium]|nr:glycosyltransferase family 2 protein [Thermoanaerobaculia bacterium]